MRLARGPRHHAARPLRCLHPALRPRCAPCKRDCSVLNLVTRRRGGTFYPDEIDIQETHPKHRKLDSQVALPHPMRDRPADGLRPKAWPLRASGCDHDPGRLPPWPAGLGGLRPAMAADRTLRGPPARSPGQERDLQRTSNPAVTRCGRCASYAGITRETPTYSFPNAVGRSAPLGSTASSSASGRPPRCHSRSTRTCSAMPVGSSSPTMATTRGPSSTTWATKTFSTPSGTPNWRPTDSKTFGGTDAPARAGTPLRQTLHGGIIVRSRARRRWHTLLRLALVRPDRGVSLHHQPVWLALYGL